MSFVKISDIMDATEGGLNILATYYPEAPAALSTRHKKFKARGDEKTASASIRQKEDGWYYITDFGGDSKERNAVEVCMLEEGLEFGEACAELGARFSVEGASSSSQLAKPIIEKRARGKDEKAGTYYFERKDFTKEELAAIGPAVTDKHAFDFNFKSLDSFTYIKEDGVTITKSTPEYPIFSFHYEAWQKLYQPNSIDKGYRFRYAGTKPRKFIHGMDALKKAFQENKSKVEDEFQEMLQTGQASKAKKPDPRLEACFIVSGGSDGLNLKSFGHYPIWFNSESEQLEWEDYKKLVIWVKEIFYIADLDNTGINQAVKLGLKFLDIRLVWLPQELRKFRDKRGNPRKDFKDFVTVYYKSDKPKAFENLLKSIFSDSVPMKFWSELRTEKGTKYYFKNTRAYHFLRHLGFARYETVNHKDGYVYIRQHNGIVKIVRPVDVKGFVTNFLVQRRMPEDLKDVVYTTGQLNESSLTNLPYVEIDFTDSNRDSQHLFFKNEVWNVSGEGVERIRYDRVKCVTWEEKVIERRVHLQEKQFNITKDPDGDWDIELLRDDNQFLNYLINTSRMHWRKDLEESFGNHEQLKAEEYAEVHKFDIAAPNLNADEILEQKLHLINKIYTMGYMLHKNKNSGRPWAPYAMDHKIADIAESHGGSGKSIFLKSIQNMLKNYHYINGRDRKKTSDDFIYHGVSAETDYLLVDDCHSNMDYGFFYNAITGDLDVNNKNGLRYNIPFAESPKIAFASNYPPNNLDPSLERRLLYVVFSDYYHHNKDGEYLQNRPVMDDFDKKNLFDDWNDKQWNTFYNFCAQCLQFYLATPDKVNPPMQNVEKRNLLKEMGDAFHAWADVFFNKRREKGEAMHLDQYVHKLYAFEDFVKETKLSKTSANKFKKSLRAYSKYNGWIFNPKDLVNSDGRIMRKINGNTEEHFYIRSSKGLPADQAKIEVIPDDDFWAEEETAINTKY